MVQKVYSIQDVGEYSLVKGKLESKGTAYKTKTISSGGGQGGGCSFASTCQLFVPIAMTNREHSRWQVLEALGQLNRLFPQPRIYQLVLDEMPKPTRAPRIYIV
jgi:hypothetical protein